MRLLFTCVGRRVELLQAFRNAAKQLDTQLVICGADSDPTAPALAFCDEAHIVPRIADGDYIQTLVDLCVLQRADALIPTIDTDLLALAKARLSFFEVGTEVVVSDWNMIAACRDKRMTSSLFSAAGLDCPTTCDDWRAYKSGYPAFIKPKDGSSSINAFKVADYAELEEFAARVPDYIVQPFIDGTEFTVDVMCDLKGDPIYVTPRIRLATRAGEVSKTEMRQDEIIASEVLRLVEVFKPRGPMTIQLIREHGSGKDYYIEINPRFGGGAPLSMKAGADGAAALLRILNGETVPFSPFAAEDGAIFSRFDQSVRVK